MEKYSSLGRQSVLDVLLSLPAMLQELRLVIISDFAAFLSVLPSGRPLLFPNLLLFHASSSSGLEKFLDGERCISSKFSIDAERSLSLHLYEPRQKMRSVRL